MKSALSVYKHNCAKRSCGNLVKAKGDLCDNHLLDKYNLNSYPANAMDDTQCYIKEEPVVEVIRKLDRKLRRK